ncbi:MAG: hypothetical protein SGJ20_04235 [Planctomycetota bacterium]|nr:hypothetical protein [Planctomycetota bacterium]
MGRILGLIGTIAGLLCIATLLTQAILLGYAWSKGMLTQDRVAKIMAVAQGNELVSVAAKVEDNTTAKNQIGSFEELDQKRAMQMRHLELREQAIQNALDQVTTERDKLLKEKKTFELLVAEYRKQIADAEAGQVKKGQEDVRLIWENIKPKLAKELILKMIDADEKEQVVVILSAMPINKQSKIVSEFKSEDEQKKLDEIMRLIRQGPTKIAPPTELSNR